jgi:hypothetical protein
MKSLKIYVTYLVFVSLVLYSGYLYSLRLDYVPWGSRHNDGLFFLAYYIIILPLLIIAAIIKRIFLKDSPHPFIKNSFFLYLLIISLPALDTHGSQISLALGVIACALVCVCILAEIAIYGVQPLNQ